MQGDGVQNDLYNPNNIKCVEVNSYQSTTSSKMLVDSVQAIQKTLGSLERSLHKSSKYEQKLVKCRQRHGHSHDFHSKWDGGDQLEQMSFKVSHTNTNPSESSRSDVRNAESWSTMSILCLQYQYEELSKRYEALLQAYDQQCSAISIREMRLSQWRQRASLIYMQLTHAHKSLLTVGEKYLRLKSKRNALASWYEKRLNHMKDILYDIVEVTAREQLRFHAKLSYFMSAERNSDAALLLYEIRKCNLLFLENMRLKTIIEELMPGHLNWRNIRP